MVTVNMVGALTALNSCWISAAHTHFKFWKVVESTKRNISDNKNVLPNRLLPFVKEKGEVNKKQPEQHKTKKLKIQK